MGLIAGIALGLACFWLGWICAHGTVATECRRLGGFYVGDTIYTCTAIKSETHHQPPPAPPRPPRR